MAKIKVQKKLFEGQILRNFPLRKPGQQGNYLIQISISEIVKCNPGQFFKIDLTGQLDRTKMEIPYDDDGHNALIIKSLPLGNEFVGRQPLIARPYSVGLCETEGRETRLTFLYKILGPGSGRLSERMPGEKLIVLGPLGGNGFYLPKGKKRALMVAGGVGLPPLLFLSRQLLDDGIDAVGLFIGANTSDKLPLHAEFKMGVKAHDAAGWPRIFGHLTDPRLTIEISTDDGSEGHHGLVTEPLERYLESADRPDELVVYTCGPWRMMARTAAVARKYGLPCQVCLEEMMGCGIGACQSCVTKMRSDNDQGWEFKLVCRDGPVFDANEVIWEAK